MSSSLPALIIDETYSFIKKTLNHFNWNHLNTIINSHFDERRGHKFLSYTDVLPSLVFHSICGRYKDSIPLSSFFALNCLAAQMFDDSQDGLKSAWDGIDLLSAGTYLMNAATWIITSRYKANDTYTDIHFRFFHTVSLAAQSQSSYPSISELSLNTYFSNVLCKTGNVFSFATWSGAKLALGISRSKLLKDISQFGEYIGIASQIIDDVKDCYDETHSHHDLSNQVYTLPVIHALHQSNNPNHNRLNNLLQNSRNDQSAQAEIDRLLANIGSYTWSNNLANFYFFKASILIKSLSDEINNTWLIDYVTNS